MKVCNSNKRWLPQRFQTPTSCADSQLLNPLLIDYTSLTPALKDRYVHDGLRYCFLRNVSRREHHYGQRICNQTVNDENEHSLDFILPMLISGMMIRKLFSSLYAVRFSHILRGTQCTLDASDSRPEALHIYMSAIG